MTNDVFNSFESLCATLNLAHRRLLREELSLRHRAQIESAFDYLLYKRASTEEAIASLFDMIARATVESDSAAYSDVVYEILDTTSVAASAS